MAIQLLLYVELVVQIRWGQKVDGLSCPGWLSVKIKLIEHDKITWGSTCSLTAW